MGTPAPFTYQQFFDNDGDPAAGYQLFTYSSGTTTKATTYSDAALSVPNTNPIILNVAGACSLYLVPGTTYKLVLATPADTDPPTSPLWSRDYVPAVPLTASSPDISGTAGEDGSAGQVVYLSDGTGARTAGRWYLGDANTPAYSTLPNAVGLLTADTTTGNACVVRLIGQVTGMSALATGTVYYIDTTPGELTSSAPSNARAVCVADSTTSVVCSQWVTVPAASATVPGIVTTGAQAFAGAKTFGGAIVASSSVLSTSATAGVGYGTGAGGTVTQSTDKSTGVTLNKVCGEITMNNAALNATTAVAFTLTNSAIAITDAVIVNIKSAATAGAYDVTVEAVAAGSCSISLYNRTAGPLSEAVVLSYVVVKGVAA